MTDRRPRRKPAAACSCDPQLLGEIKGKLDMIHEGQKTHGQQLEGLDARIRSQENKGAIAGAVGGLLVALGVSIASGWIKGKS